MFAVFARSEGKDLPYYVGLNRSQVVEEARKDTRLFIRRVTDKELALYFSKWYQVRLDDIRLRVLQ